jgi:hypothetical protein
MNSGHAQQLSVYPHKHALIITPSQCPSAPFDSGRDEVMVQLKKKKNFNVKECHQKHRATKRVGQFHHHATFVALLLCVRILLLASCAQGRVQIVEREASTLDNSISFFFLIIYHRFYTSIYLINSKITCPFLIQIIG